MLTSALSKFKDFLSAGHERTVRIKKNIILSFIIKGASVLISYLLIPLTISYLDKLQYGIWVTIISLVAWVNTFDIGLGNGLRNKLAHSLALGEKENIVKYISTTYAILFLISSAIFIVFFAGGSFFNWNHLLSVPPAINYNIWPIVLITLGTFCMQFALQPINSVLTATHDPFKSSLILLLCQALTLISVFALTQFTHSSLTLLVIAASCSPVVVFLGANIYLFSTSLKDFAPRLKSIDFSGAKSLVNLGGAFFFIQIGALILYQTDNIVIAKTIGLQDVTVFNVAYKYFSILIILFSIILTPYWSAFTDAYAKKDMEWIKQALKKLRRLWVYATIGAILLCVISVPMYRFWIGNAVAVPVGLSVALAINASVQIWQVIHAYMLNGVGKLRVQLILLIITGILNIPLSIILIKYWGIQGTVIANIIMMMLMNIAFTYQCRLIVRGEAKGVWAK